MGALISWATDKSNAFIYFSLLFLPAVALICAAGYYAIRYVIESWKLPIKKQLAFGALGIFLFARKPMPGSAHHYLRCAFIFSAGFLLYTGLLAFFIDRLGAGS